MTIEFWHISNMTMTFFIVILFWMWHKQIGYNLNDSINFMQVWTEIEKIKKKLKLR